MSVLFHVCVFLPLSSSLLASLSLDPFPRKLLTSPSEQETKSILLALRIQEHPWVGQFEESRGSMGVGGNSKMQVCACLCCDA